MKRNRSNPIIRSIISFLTAGIAMSCSNYDNPSLSVTQGNFNISYNIDAVMHDTDGKAFMLPDSLSEPVSVSLVITDTESDSKNIWDDISKFTSDSYFRPGRYAVHLEAKSRNDIIKFCGDTIVNLKANETAGLNLTLRPKTAWVVNEIESKGQYTVTDLSFHALTTGSNGLTTQTSPETFIEAGVTEVVAGVTDRSGRAIRVNVGDAVAITSATRYNFTTSVGDNNVLTYTDQSGMLTGSIALNDELFKSNALTLTTSGFTDGEPVPAIEGITLSRPITMTVSSTTPLTHLYLGVVSPLVNLLNGSTEAFELDFLNLTAEQAEILNRSSLSVEFNSDKTSAVIDFTHSIEGLASVISARSIFNVTAVNSLGLVTEPRALIVDTETVNLAITNVTPAVIGIDESTITVKSSRQGIEVSDFDFETTDGSKCTVVSSAKNTDGTIDFTIAVPEGLTSTEIVMNYVGLKRDSFTVKRAVPEFGVFPDGYATSARLRIVGQNEHISRTLTRLLSFKIDKTDVSVVSRDTTTCTVVINGLSPAREYRLDSFLGNLTPTQTTKFMTEQALGIPDGDLEDADPLIKFKHLPVGGRYALTSLDIVNRQNYADIEVYWPKKYWASINDRTFCRDARHKNSWFMQASSEIAWEGVSGTKSISVKSVGWDLDGETIPDWVPAPGSPKAEYSNSIPAVRHRSAGRLFLGSYSFNPVSMTEIYNEGVAFTSRPSSLNGFFKYTPDFTDQGDKGLIEVKLVRRDNNVSEIVVASGRLLFSSCPDFKSFNLPLEYERLDIKPTHLKIMIFSSSKADDEPIDDKDVPVTAHPEKGAYIGSILTIDNLTFTY